MRCACNLVAGSLFLTILLFVDSTDAAEPKSFSDRESFAAYKRDYARVPVTAFQFDEQDGDDLKIEVWATSPLIFSPVAMDVDPQGRVWVTEGIDYSVGRRVDTGQSIIVLTDTDADGKADKSHVFISERKLRHAPLGIAVFDNRIVLSATPDLIVYTDVNRNAVFDEGIDKREVLLTGFQGRGHDHTLHAVIGGPNGQWYFSYGNKGADIQTRDGRRFISSSYYGFSEAAGKKSSDGHLYVGGLAMRVNPDGTGLQTVGQNLRNTHDMFVTSMGDVFHSDNDDPPHCRVTWLMEHGNLGYADLRDGSKSWEEVAKPWEKPQGNAGRYAESHWRQLYPGTLPPGNVYGAGSPTGNVFIEGDELGKKYRGRYLVTDMVRKEVMGHSPQLKDAQIEMGEKRPFISLKPESKKEHFLPTDVALNIDGSLLLSDFYNSTSRRTLLVSGTIYRISRRGDTNTIQAKVDLESNAGLMTAIMNPAVNVRHAAFTKLREQGDGVFPFVKVTHANLKNPYHRARLVWLMSQLGELGQKHVESMLKSDDEPERIVAFRALRFALPQKVLGYAKTMAKDESASVRREVALALRDVPFAESKSIIAELIKGYDGKNRWYLEAIGTAATGKEDEVYEQIVRPQLTSKSFGKWNGRDRNLAWRMHTRQAIDDLYDVITSQAIELEELRRLLMAFAMFTTDEDREYRMKKVESFASVAHYASDDFQLTIREVIDRDLRGLKPELLRTSYLMPNFASKHTKLSPIDTIAKMSGDFERGKIRASSCLACHQISGNGSAFGPNMTAWGKERTIEQIVKDIVDPNAHLAHGYERSVRVVAGKHVAEGLLINYSHHAGSLKLKIFGGEIKKILFRKSGGKTNHLKNRSWMPSASELGLTDQDVRDIAEYLKRL